MWALSNLYPSCLSLQIVVVVTASFHVFCYDYNLKLMWTSTINDEAPQHASVRQVAVLITPHIMRQYDRGMVIVGSSVRHGRPSDHENLVVDDDALQAELDKEAQQLRHQHSFGSSDKLEDLDANSEVKGADTERHFSYFAFDGAWGYQRWRHEPTSFHKDLADLEDKQQSVESYRYGIVSFCG